MYHALYLQTTFFNLRRNIKCKGVSHLVRQNKVYAYEIKAKSLNVLVQVSCILDIQLPCVQCSGNSVDGTGEIM